MTKGDNPNKERRITTSLPQQIAAWAVFDWEKEGKAHVYEVHPVRIQAVSATAFDEDDLENAMEEYLVHILTAGWVAPVRWISSDNVYDSKDAAEEEARRRACR